MILSDIQHYGYAAVFFGILLEDFGLPLPGETMLIAASVAASRGHLSIAGVVLAACLGAFIGDNIGYVIGRFGGRRLALRYGRYVFLNEERLGKVEGFFRRHGGKIVVAARFFSGLRQFNGIVAGIGKMRWPRFGAFNLAGAALWVGWWSGVTFFMGEKSAALFHLFMKGMLAGWVVIALAIAVWIWVRARRGDM